MIKYGVFNNNTGEYSFVETKEEALQLFWSNVVEMALTYFHGTAYVTVDTNEDGSEVWRNDNLEEIDRPRTADEITAILSKITKAHTIP